MAMPWKIGQASVSQSSTLRSYQTGCSGGKDELSPDSVVAVDYTWASMTLTQCINLLCPVTCFHYFAILNYNILNVLNSLCSLPTPKENLSKIILVCCHSQELMAVLVINMGTENLPSWQVQVNKLMWLHGLCWSLIYANLAPHHHVSVVDFFVADCRQWLCLPEALTLSGMITMGGMRISKHPPIVHPAFGHADCLPPQGGCGTHDGPAIRMMTGVWKVPQITMGEDAQWSLHGSGPGSW